MISLSKRDDAPEQNNQALWAALPWLFYCVRVRWEQTWFLFNGHILSHKSPPLPPLSQASVCMKQAHEAQWQALFSKRHKQHRGQPRLILSHSLLLLLLSLSPFCLHFPFYLPLYITPLSVVSLLMFVLWSRISKHSINLRWALRLW